jgi:CheY-like chemotaxis protein
MGGRIWVESEGESGSVFHFSIDLKPVENPEPTSGFESKKNLLDDFRGASVIIVEDNRTSGEILSEMLSEKGLNPLLVSGREELEEKMKENGEKQAISLSVVDVPAEESVFNEIFGVLDKHLGDRGRTLYLVPLGMQDRYVLQQGVFPGCIIEKPVKQDELMESVYRLLSGEITCETDVKSRDLPVYSSPNPLKILLVEDNVLNRHLALGLLKTRGHIVSVARDGREAVEAFGKNDFDLILMDVQMPEMDGLEASRRIREMESGTGRRTPVIAMTAHAMEGDRQRCIQAGMDSYITKPFRKETFFEIVETAGSMIDDYPEKERAAEDGKDRPVIEKKTLMELTGGSAELVRELVQIYLEKLPGQIADIRESVEEGDSGKLEFSAHSLKGMSLNLSANIVARKAFELEQMGRNDELEGAEEVFQGLEKDIEILKRALEDLLEEMAGSG